MEGGRIHGAVHALHNDCGGRGGLEREVAELAPHCAVGAVLQESRGTHGAPVCVCVCVSRVCVRARSCVRVCVCV